MNYNSPYFNPHSNPLGNESKPISFQSKGLDDSSKVISIDDDNSTQTTKKGSGGIKDCKDTLLRERIRCKDKLLKERIRTLIITKGLSESEFYNSIGISTQYWYFLSWGIWETPKHLKVRISKGLEVDSSVIWNNNNEKGGIELNGKTKIRK